ncbi:MAG TPA: MarC family protein, partial [Acidobacteriota bacterium]
LSSLFSIINPISTAPIFVAMTEGGIDRKRTAWRTSIAAGVTLAIFAAAGGAIFSFFGITVPAFQIAGGILFTLISIQTLINGKEEVPEDGAQGGDPSIVPLGIPMIAGPGAISTVMVLVGQAQDAFRIFALAVAIFVNIVLTLWVLLASPWIVRRMGETGQRIVSKIMGLITLVIGIQFVINGGSTVIIDILKAAK